MKRQNQSKKLATMNAFAFLDEDDVTLPPKQPLSKRALKKANNSKKSFEIQEETSVKPEASPLYYIEEMWLLVLDFLPINNLFSTIILLNKCERNRMNSDAFIRSMLLRDVKTYHKVLGKTVLKRTILINDPEEYFVSVFNSIDVPRFKPVEVKKPKNKTFTLKQTFQYIHKILYQQNKEIEQEMENRLHHARIFIERSLKNTGQLSLIHNKVKECSHFKLKRIEEDVDNFKYKFTCSSCGLTLRTNFLPENIFKQAKCRKETDYGPCGLEVTYHYTEGGYMLDSTKHIFEFTNIKP